MAEIAAIVSILIALGALFLASQSFKQSSGSFDDFTKKMAKIVRESQDNFGQQVDQTQKESRKTAREVSALESTNRDLAEKVSTLTQRLAVVEFELQTLKESIPKQYLRPPAKRDDKSAAGR